MVQPFIPWGEVDVTVCLHNERATQHCNVLDTDAFDIVSLHLLLRSQLLHILRHLLLQRRRGLVGGASLMGEKGW